MFEESARHTATLPETQQSSVWLYLDDFSATLTIYLQKALSAGILTRTSPLVAPCRSAEAHLQAEAVELVRDPAGEVRVASGGGRRLRLVPPHHVGAAAGGKSHGGPMSATPLDDLLVRNRAGLVHGPSGLYKLSVGGGGGGSPDTGPWTDVSCAADEVFFLFFFFTSSCISQWEEGGVLGVIDLFLFLISVTSNSGIAMTKREKCCLTVKSNKKILNFNKLTTKKEEERDSILLIIYLSLEK